MGCWRGPRAGTSDVEIYTSLQGLEYDDYCHDCWPKGRTPNEKADRITSSSPSPPQPPVLDLSACSDASLDSADESSSSEEPEGANGADSDATP